MDEGKILVVNLSKGLIGEDNAGILGAFLVTKVQLAAMSRSDIPNVADRRPFYLYVDEFQNFATDSFATILSEARKYGLNLTVANQYIAQMTDTVRDAVFGNVGTTISFRVAPEDADALVKQFEPTFEASDLIQLNNRHFIISMIINGEKAPAFSATTLSIPTSPHNNFNAIIQNSRAEYSRPRSEIETEIRATIEQSEKYKKELSDSGRQSQPNSPDSTRPHLPSNYTSRPYNSPKSAKTVFNSKRPAPKIDTDQANYALKNLGTLIKNSPQSSPEAPEALYTRKSTSNMQDQKIVVKTSPNDQPFNKPLISKEHPNPSSQQNAHRQQVITPAQKPTAKPKRHNPRSNKNRTKSPRN